MAKQQSWHKIQQRNALKIAKALGSAMISLDRAADNDHIDVNDARQLLEVRSYLGGIQRKYLNTAGGPG